MRIGIDLGGTKVEAIALDTDGSELIRRRVPTPSHDYRAIIDAIAELVRGVEKDLGRTGTVGVGIPGTIEAVTGLVKNANTVVLNGNPLDKDLGAALGREVRVMNDANCMLASEAGDGAAAGARVAFGVIIGTGCGGAVAIDGRPLVGANAIAGEWGHNPLPWATDDERPGHSCYCGKSGCIEGFLAGPSLARDHGTGQKAAEIAAAAEAGDATAEASLQRYEDRLARALTTIIHVLDPDVIVLGGGVSNLKRLYTNVPPRIEKLIFGGGPLRTRLVQSKHGDSTGVRGAAWLWPIA
ncbi:ROK family protein [Lacibacterium aquatile]|uniref:ROK family protein n=1 Tax=Lacibacterium aquatile TaxID=1168082 RepID=A0ABW5DNL7_9PROT